MRNTRLPQRKKKKTPLNKNNFIPIKHPILKFNHLEEFGGGHPTIQ